jgi:hypothetical protein
MQRLLPIVEGDAEMRAVPTLIRRTLQHHNRYDINLLRPQQRGDIYSVKKNISRSIRMAMKEKAAVLWVLDCDDGCPVELVHELTGLSTSEYKPYPLEFAFMVKEFESLFLADADSTRSRLNINSSIPFPQNPESIRGVKEWLSKYMLQGQIYKPTVHQEALSAIINIDILRDNSPSFRHFERALLRLVS